jgi:hypothetical protein
MILRLCERLGDAWWRLHIIFLIAFILEVSELCHQLPHVILGDQLLTILETRSVLVFLWDCLLRFILCVVVSIFHRFFLYRWWPYGCDVVELLGFARNLHNILEFWAVVLQRMV